MSINSLDSLIAGLASSNKYKIYKATVASTTAGQMHSLWRAVGGWPSQGAIPTVVEKCYNGMLGSIQLPAIDVAKDIHIAKLTLSSTVANYLLLCDRLKHIGGLNGTLLTAQSVNMNITDVNLEGRCQADGSDVLWTLEWYVNTGATASVATISYTNQDDVAGKTTTVTLAATRTASTVLPILPATGDKYIKSIQSVTLSASTATAGNFGITARKQLVEMPIQTINTGNTLDYALLGLPKLTGLECLEMCVICTTTSTGVMIGSIDIIQG